LVVVCLIGIAWWYFLPAIYITVLPLFQDKGNSDLLYRRLFVCGPRSIPFIIKTIRSDSAWGTDYGDLPLVLGRFGEPAHKALLLAIDGESDITRSHFTNM
jgi:hypothetical protein